MKRAALRRVRIAGDQSIIGFIAALEEAATLPNLLYKLNASGVRKLPQCT